jgi:cytochrome P450
MSSTIGFLRTMLGLPPTAPGPRSRPLIGCFPEFKKDSVAFLTGAVRDHGEIVRLKLGPEVVHVITHPDHVRHVTQDNYKNYLKSDLFPERARSLVGSGMVWLNGDTWVRHRKLAQPAFHRERLARFIDVIVRVTAESLDRWDRQGETIDVMAEMLAMTMRMAGLILFSVDVKERTADVEWALPVAVEHVISRLWSLAPIPESIPTPQNRRYKKALGTLNSVVYDIIGRGRRKGAGEGPNDVLSMLLAARDDETGRGLTDQEVRDEVMTLFLAGHETTTSALCWTFYYLSMVPEAVRRLREEAATVLGDRLPTFDDLTRLTYTSWVFQEAMRIRPPIYLFDRRVAEADEIGGYPIPKGSIVIVSPFLTHRHPGFWDNPEGFDPQRFHPDAVGARHRYAYLPFGAGPRTCIGNRLAMMQAQIILPMVLRRYRLSLVPGAAVTMAPLGTLQPRGLAMTVRPA